MFTKPNQSFAGVRLGLGSGTFIMTTMQYRWVLLPIGVAGVSLGYVFHVCEKRCCARFPCRMAVSRWNFVMLVDVTLLLFEREHTLAPSLADTLLVACLIMTYILAVYRAVLTPGS